MADEFAPMRDEFSRSLLEVDRLYYCGPNDSYFHTPDGVGVYWYEDKAQAMEQTGAFSLPIITINQPLSDW